MSDTYLVTPSGAYAGYTDSVDYGVRGFPLVLAEAKAIISRLQGIGVFAPGKNLLDLGCGPGFLLKEAATISLSPGSPHFGLDESTSMVLYAIRYLQLPNPSNVDAAAGPKVRCVDIRDASKVRAALR